MSPECNLKGRIKEPEEKIECEGEISMYEEFGMWLCKKHFQLIRTLEQNK